MPKNTLRTSMYNKDTSFKGPYKRFFRRNPFLRRNLRLILSIALVVWVLSATYALLVYKPKYNSTASVLIKDSAWTSRYITPDEQNTTSSAYSNSVLNTMTLLGGDDVRHALWTNFLMHHHEELEHLKLRSELDWIELFADGKKFIHYQNLPGTDNIGLRFSWSDPYLAQEGMATILNAFQMASLDMNRAEHYQRYTYLSSQVNDVRNQLTEVRNKIRIFKEKNHTSDIGKELENYAKSRVDFQMAAAVAAAEAGAYRTQLASYTNVLGMDSKSAVKAVALGRNQTLAKLVDSYYQADEDYRSLKTRYTDEQYLVKQAKSRMEQIQADILHEQMRMGFQPNSNSARQAIMDETRGNAVRDMLSAAALSSAAGVKARIMKSHLAQMSRSIGQLPKVEQALADLKESETALSDSLKTLEQQALDARIREAQTLSNVFIINQPTLSRKPAFPDRIHIILLGLIAGLMAGFGVAIIQQKFKSPSGGTPKRVLLDPLQEKSFLLDARILSSSNVNS